MTRDPSFRSGTTRLTKTKWPRWLVRTAFQSVHCPSPGRRHPPALQITASSVRPLRARRRHRCAGARNDARSSSSTPTADAFGADSSRRARPFQDRAPRRYRGTLRRQRSCRLHAQPAETPVTRMRLPARFWPSRTSRWWIRGPATAHRCISSCALRSWSRAPYRSTAPWSSPIDAG